MKQMPPDTRSHNKRIEFIDGLRGFSMLLVIYIHVFLFLTPSFSETNKILIKFRMPLFFFISGFFMYSFNYSVDLLQRRTKNRLIKQLLPTILIFILYISLSGRSFVDGLASPNKAGYWFTFVSVEIFMIIAPILCFFSVNRYRKMSQLAILALLGILSYSIKCFIMQSNSPSPWIYYLDINFITAFMPYVILGCMLKMLWNEYEHSLIRLHYFVLAIIIFCIAYLFDFFANDLLCGICGIYAMFYLFYNIPERFFQYKIGKLLSLIGRSTLEIYLLHYFCFGFINRVPYVLDMLSPLLSTADSIWEFPAFLFISILIAFGCLFVVKVMKLLKIYRFIFPEPNDLRTVRNRLLRNNHIS